MAIQFTEYMLPDGRTRPQWIDRPNDIEMKANALIMLGFRFEIEVLTSGMVSAEIRSSDRERLVVNCIAPNGPGLEVGLDRMIERGYSMIVHPQQFPLASED